MLPLSFSLGRPGATHETRPTLGINRPSNTEARLAILQIRAEQRRVCVRVQYACEEAPLEKVGWSELGPACGPCMQLYFFFPSLCCMTKATHEVPLLYWSSSSFSSSSSSPSFFPCPPMNAKLRSTAGSWPFDWTRARAKRALFRVE